MVRQRTIVPANPAKETVSIIGCCVTKEGYLLKRSHKRLRIWVRRWFVLEGNRIMYGTRKAGNGRRSFSALIEDTRLCNVRSNDQCERKFVFEVKSPISHHVLQAESHWERQSWIDAINKSITESLRNSGSLSYGGSSSYLSMLNDGSISMLSCDSVGIKSNMIQERKEMVISTPGNDKCADCSANGPDWVSVNIGAFLCMQCSGVHRSLGVNVSKIRSLHMDDWDVETLIMLSKLGNKVVNEIYEASLSMPKPLPNCTSNQRSKFIRAKYEEKMFIRNEISQIASNEKLLGTVDVRVALEAVVHGADVNCRSSETGETPLIFAIKKHSIAMVEFLLVNNASTNIVDNLGLSPLHHAVLQSVSFRCQVISLIKRNAACHILDANGLTPLDYALKREDPDVVTWLRLVNLHKQLETDDPNMEKSFLPFLEDPAYLLELATMFPV